MNHVQDHFNQSKVKMMIIKLNAYRISFANYQIHNRYKRLLRHGNVSIRTMRKRCRNTNGIIRHIPLNKTLVSNPNLPPSTSFSSDWDVVFTRGSEI